MGYNWAQKEDSASLNGKYWLVFTEKFFFFFWRYETILSKYAWAVFFWYFYWEEHIYPFKCFFKLHQAGDFVSHSQWKRFAQGPVCVCKTNGLFEGIYSQREPLSQW